MLYRNRQDAEFISDFDRVVEETRRLEGKTENKHLGPGTRGRKRCGSYAWGEPGERSDVDLLVEGCADPMMVAALVGRACGLDVHVIDMSEAPPSLLERVRADGVPL